MCDEQEFERVWGLRSRKISRRAFGAGGIGGLGGVGTMAGITALGGAATVLGACSPAEGNEGRANEGPGNAGADSEPAKPAGLTESQQSIIMGGHRESPKCDAEFIHPSTGKHPAVIFWPDIAGIRAANRIMARRLAAAGFAVLLANPYYRDTPAPRFTDLPQFFTDDGFATTAPWRDKFSGGAIMQDTADLVAWLDQQEAVDTSKGIGAQGYCMTGSFAFYAAAGAPHRVKAAASFHGGGLVRGDATDSPHSTMGKAKAAYLVAIAQDDDAKDPAAKQALRVAADNAGRDAEIKVFPAGHGWCVGDAPSFNKPQAERAWAQLLALYQAAL